MISMILALAVGCQPASTASDDPAQAQQTEGATQAEGDGGIVRGGTLYARRIGIVPINPMETIAPTIDKMVYGLFMEPCSPPMARTIPPNPAWPKAGPIPTMAWSLR